MNNICNVCHEEMNEEDMITGMESPLDAQNIEGAPMIFRGHQNCVENAGGTSLKKQPPDPAKVF